MNIIGFSFSFIKFSVTEKYAKRLFEQGQPEIIRKNYGKPRNGKVMAYLTFRHDLPGSVSIRKIKKPWTLFAKEYDGAGNVPAGKEEQLRVLISAKNIQQTEFDLKYLCNGQYMLVEKKKHF